ncbi:hypothetical protein Pfl04_34240 [Planosporangium flavigriseum]|uniref:Transposase n=1 Tax=Planosporangium flavigriseum TaxID=373681 RepID=A0A8J3LQK5_9ACTN|nr:hypothetical protein Pfl04_34240 [Planosporangium flavigriseum]
MECGIYRLKHNRTLTTGYDKLAMRHQTRVHIAAINEWPYYAYETWPIGQA